MATVRHLTITLTGAAQRLATGQLDNVSEDFALQIWLQPAAANSGAIFVGGAGVSTSDYGVRLEIPATGIPPAPFSLGDLFPPVAATLGDIWVIGTENDVLQVLVVGYPKV